MGSHSESGSSTIRSIYSAVCLEHHRKNEYLVLVQNTVSYDTIEFVTKFSGLT